MALDFLIKNPSTMVASPPPSNPDKLLTFSGWAVALSDIGLTPVSPIPGFEKVCGTHKP